MKYNFCKNCGSPVQPGMPNCQRCGAAVDQVQPIDENKPMAQPPGLLRQYYDNNGVTNNQQPMMDNNQPMAQPVTPQQTVQQSATQQPMPQQPAVQQSVTQQSMMYNNQQNNPRMGQPMYGQPMMNGQIPQQKKSNNSAIILVAIILIIGGVLLYLWKCTDVLTGLFNKADLTCTGDFKASGFSEESEIVGKGTAYVYLKGDNVDHVDLDIDAKDETVATETCALYQLVKTLMPEETKDLKIDCKGKKIKVKNLPKETFATDEKTEVTKADIINIMKESGLTCK